MSSRPPRILARFVAGAPGGFASRVKLRVNPIRCTAHGLCSELLPERVSLDEWGYPVIDGTPISNDLMADARRAANACSTLALFLERVEA